MKLGRVSPWNKLGEMKNVGEAADIHPRQLGSGEL